MIKRLALFLFTVFVSFSAFSQGKLVKGLVRAAETNEAIPGVNVLIKGTSTGVITDFNGQFSIQVPDSETILSFSFIGLESREVKVGSKADFIIDMKESAQQLEQVVVVGYGTQIKKELTGSISSVKSKDLQDIAVPSVQAAMQGKASGVFVQQSGGKIDGGVTVRIRGMTSVSGSNQPLYIVDGIPIVMSSESTNGASTNPLNTISMSDIESVEVLKDASASAIYGSRGANGVIIITTKKGSEGQTKFNLDFAQGYSSPTKVGDWLGAKDYVNLLLESAKNADSINGTGISSQSYVRSRFNTISNNSDWELGEVETDWNEEVFQQGNLTKLGFSASSGKENTQLYFSTNWYDQVGILRNNDMNRLSLRLNLNQKLNNKVSLGMNTMFSRTNYNRIANDNSFTSPLQSTAQAPISPAFSNGKPFKDTHYYNFLREIDNAHFKTLANRTLTNVHLEYKILKNLKFRSESAYEYFQQQEEIFNGKETLVGESNDGQASYNTVKHEKVTLNNYLNYKNKFGKHGVDITSGVSYEYSLRKAAYITKKGFPSDELFTSQSGALVTQGTDNTTHYAFSSAFGRLNYNFNNRYLLGFSLRADGTSRFAKKNRWGYFPAASLGWLVSEESFIPKNLVLNFLKLKLSYGQTGNANISNFSYLGLYGTSAYGRLPGLVQSQLSNQELGWETTNQFDFGLDFGLLEDRISGELSLYSKQTKDMLLSYPLQGTSGFGSISRNFGKMKNDGFELSLTSNNLSGKLSWKTELNFSTNKNTITQLDKEIINNQSIAREGEEIGAFYMVEYAGVDANTGDALYYKNSLDTDGNLDKTTTNKFQDAKKIIVGSPHPDWYGGITNTFSYKGFSFKIGIQTVIGNDVYNGAGIYQSSNANGFDNQTENQLARWRVPGDITSVPQARFGISNGNKNSTRYLQNANFVRLKELLLAYSIPSFILKKISVQSLRLYLSATNLLTFTDYTGYDPEVQADFIGGNINLGYDFYSSPQVRTIMFGMNIGL